MCRVVEQGPARRPYREQRYAIYEGSYWIKNTLVIYTGVEFVGLALVCGAAGWLIEPWWAVGIAALAPFPARQLSNAVYEWQEVDLQGLKAGIPPPPQVLSAAAQVGGRGSGSYDHQS